MKRLVLDIETIPISPDVITPEEAKKAALDALTGRIVCIGFIVVDEVDEFEALSAVSIVCEDERKLLREFWSMLRRENIKSFVAHNGLGFDLPYIWRRSVVNQIKPSLQLDLRRYRNDSVYDTMCVWGNWEAWGNASLNALANGFGLGDKSGSGDQVLQLWREGRYREIAEYCLHDCWLTYQCFGRMNFSPTTDKDMIKQNICIDVTVVPHGSISAVEARSPVETVTYCQATGSIS
jgi:predicted PolB exonuclease-like 3'-5' exonuclease